MDFQYVANCLADIQYFSSNSQKQALLRKYGREVEGFTDVLKFIYDPYFVTGLKHAKLDRVGCALETPTVEDIMDYLAVNNTGTDADAAYANAFIYSVDDEVWRWAAEGLVTKDLQIGVNVTTLNAVFGASFIPRIGIMRGMICPEDWTGYGIVTEKIDGNRRLFFNYPGGVKTYTRSGKPDTGLAEIEAEISAYLPKGYVYDCECVAEGSYGDNIELRQASASVLNRRNQLRTGVRALCFDALPIAEYNDGSSIMNAIARKTRLAAMFGDANSLVKLFECATCIDIDRRNAGVSSNISSALKELSHEYMQTGHTFEHIRALPILGMAMCYKDGVEYAKRVWDVHGEGVMLNEWQAPYEVNPNPRKTLLKIKMLKEYTAHCVDIYEGDNKYTGMMGGIIVNMDGAVFGVGTGFTDYDRDYLWRHRDAIVGKYVELESFGESQNKQGRKALNCPVFKRIVGDNE